MPLQLSRDDRLVVYTNGDTLLVIAMPIGRKTCRNFAIIRRNCANRRLNSPAYNLPMNSAVRDSNPEPYRKTLTRSFLFSPQFRNRGINVNVDVARAKRWERSR